MMSHLAELCLQLFLWIVHGLSHDSMCPLKPALSPFSGISVEFSS